MIKFFHVADAHLGIENYGKIDSQTGIHSRLLDFSRSLEIVVDKAVEEQIDFLLFCGDAYKTANPTPTQQKLFAKQIMRLYQAKIPVVIIVGNHDHPLSFGKVNSLDVFSYLPLDNIYVIGKPDVCKLETKNGIVQVVGIPWPTRGILIGSEQHRFKSNSEITKYLSQRVGQIVYQLAQTLDADIPSILAAHLTVSNGVFSGAIFGNDPVFLPSQLAVHPFDYVALGHLHRYQNLNPGGIPVVYSGSIERIDFGERKEPKGFCRVVIDSSNDGARVCMHEHIELPARRMIQLEISIEYGSDFTQQIIDAIEKTEVTDAIVKILYHLPDGKNEKIDMLAIMRACSKAHFLVAVVPVFQPAVREKRAMLSVDMDFSVLLEKFFETKDFDEERKLSLLKKSQELLVLSENMLDS
jgi:exonuclease SbcD